MISKLNKAGGLLMTIDKEDVDEFNHTHQLNFLLYAKIFAKDFNGKINIMVVGYDDDERELWEIPEVREYFDFLDRCFPYWFFFLNRKLPQHLSPLSLIINLVVPIEKTLSDELGKKYSQLNMEKYKSFFDSHFHYLNELTEEIGLSIEENEMISKEVFDVLK